MNALIVAPLLIPLGTAATALLLWRSRRAQRILGIAGAAALLAAALRLLGAVRDGGVLVTQAGGWAAPFGITLVVDLLSAIMLVLAALIGLAVAAYSLFGIDPGREWFGYWPLLHVLLMGVCGAFLSGDIFNLYVWFEVMLIASFVLLALGGEKPQLEGAIKYVTLNFLSSAIFLAAVGLLYGTTGTLNMADLAGALGSGTRPALTASLAMLFLVAFGIKAAIFPFFFWLPASYHTPPVPVSAIFAGLLTKVGVYALLRVFTLLFVPGGATHALILALAGLTMVTGVLGAAAQTEFRRILSFHIVSQIGYMIMGLGLGTRAAIAGSIFYIAHHIIVKTNLFLVAGVVHRLRGTHELKRLGDLYRAHPATAALFLIPALSLAGVPPLSGFFAKLALVRAGLAIDQYAIVATALVVSLLTLFSMTKIWAEAFWKEAPGDGASPPGAASPPAAAAGEGGRAGVAGMLLPIAVLAAITVAIGVLAEPLFRLSARAAAQLLDPSGYVGAVLETRP